MGLGKIGVESQINRIECGFDWKFQRYCLWHTLRGIGNPDIGPVFRTAHSTEDIFSFIGEYFGINPNGISSFG